jgi:hypothetical protein
MYVFIDLKIKIHQTSFNCALQNFKIDVDIAIEKTQAMRIAPTGLSDSSFFYEMVKV